MKAVLFDVYETLLTGPRREDREELLRGVIAEFGIAFPSDQSIANRLDQEIATEHRRSEKLHPEVDIREIWKRTLPKLSDPEAFALAAEESIHPVSAFDQAEDALIELKRRGIHLGIISNAQAYTRTLLERHFPRAWKNFNSDLLFFSYEHRIAKPDPQLFRMAIDQLAASGIQPNEALMVGDSEKNDIEPAKALGLKTHHFREGKFDFAF